MLIDWFTVGAQALNFLVLVWLLKRYLYKPILDAVDARERRIAAGLADAEAKMAQARQQRDEFEQKNQDFARQRGALLSQAADEAKAERQRLLEEARAAADAMAAQRQQALRNEARSLDQGVRRSTREEVFAVARKTLTDLAGTDLEERVGQVFANRLRALDGPSRARLAAALRTAGEPARIRSAFKLSAQQRMVLQEALDETFSPGIVLRFEADPELISGIELSADGQKLAWSIDDYLRSLQKSIGTLLPDEEAPGIQTAGSPAQRPPEAQDKSRP
jgi:F-type H+-transporting ATPase subunit b